MTTRCRHQPLCLTWGEHQERLDVPVNEDFADDPICDCGRMGWACDCLAAVEERP